MELIITPAWLFEKHLWDKYCEITGTNEWAVAEGMDSDEKIFLTEEEADKLGIDIKV
jgi:hypothetical protein